MLYFVKDLGNNLNNLGSSERGRDWGGTSVSKECQGLLAATGSSKEAERSLPLESSESMALLTT